MIRLLAGDCRDMLATLEPNSVQTCVTSPPYWGLRSYGTEPQVWGGADHEHEWYVSQRAITVGNRSDARPVSEIREKATNRNVGGRPKTTGGQSTVGTGLTCPCGAWLGELGNEPTPELFVAHMVEVFRAVWRVLRPDGTLWLNLGFSYAGSGKGPSNSLQPEASQIGASNWSRSTLNGGHGLYSDDEKVINQRRAPTTAGYKAKDLIPIPFLVATALQQDGWYWRSIIAWAKKAPMPESVTDRPTSAWEPVLLMSKSARYYYDADAVREEQSENTHARYGNGGAPRQPSVQKQAESGSGIKSNGSFYAATADAILPNGRNMRNVWLLGPEPFPQSHFAVFPTEVPRRAILAGTSEKGQCPQCGAPWERVVEVEQIAKARNVAPIKYAGGADGERGGTWTASMAEQTRRSTTTTGWRSTCGHADLEPVPQTVLDPFAGAGTTLLVADRLNRHGIGIELKADYAEMGYDRIVGDAPMFAEVVR